MLHTLIYNTKDHGTVILNMEDIIMIRPTDEEGMIEFVMRRYKVLKVPGDIRKLVNIYENFTGTYFYSE